MSVYLGEKGMTSTNANYLANLAKEISKKDETKLRKVSFVNSSVELINGSRKTLNSGWTNIAELEVCLNRISNMNAFCAWVREAIKAKENALKTIENLSLNGFCKLKNIELPEEPEVTLLTEQDIINKMDIKERNRYLELEAFAATFGKYIHPDGTISRAREDAFYREEAPNEVDGTGRDMVIYNYSPSVSTLELDKVFISLQNKYREYEKQLNAIKFDIKEKVNAQNMLLVQEHNKELDAYHQKMQSIRNALKLYVTKGREEIANLKIVIPEKLQSTYEYLNSLGK